MHKLIGNLALVAALLLVSQTPAQPPGGKGKDAPAKDGEKSTLVSRMMAFDKENTGKLTKEMVTDPRLHRLFDQADTNKDGIVTKEELQALAAKLEAQDKDREPGGRGPGGPGARGPGGDGPGGRGPGGPGGDGPGGRGPGGRGPGGPPQPGQVLPAFVRTALNLTDDQKKQLDELQQEVDAKLGKILSDEQKKQLNEMRQRGPGGFGPPGGDGKRPGPNGPKGGPKKDE